MGKFHHNNLGSVVLDQPVPGGGGGGGGGRQFKNLWSVSLRRVLLDTVRCGGRHKHSTIESATVEEPLALESDLANLKPKNRLKNDLTSKTTSTSSRTTTLRSELKRYTSNSKGASNAAAITLRSDKLSDLLRVASEDVEEIDVQRKVEVLEELKRVVKNLQEEENHPRVLEGAREVRRLSKDDSEARTTLALLGAIPPLVALLDAPPPYRDLPFQVAALYALLNLGIGNDA